MACSRRERPRALLATLEHANVLGVAAAGWPGPAPAWSCARRTSSTGRPSCRHGPGCCQVHAPAYRAADGVVAVSDAVAASLLGELGLAAAACGRCNNPVIMPVLRQLAAAPLDDPWFGPAPLP